MFCGKRCKCKRRCKAWYAAQPDLERGCTKACSTDSGLTRERYECSGNWINESVIIGAYGYDPCPNSGYDLQDYLDPTGAQAKEQEQLSDLQPILLMFGVLILAGLGVLFVLKR